ncbi:E3 ubiquitin-protein ligase ORTHRUS 2-like [Argentina anserina]|uniref:E3 ubiquitin-protein ligase ORTHRUS 2-like n=1 Tax=Argentina anserina TaxID=57926 RepID=UPI0021764355|nr:E3 ubiquitin-protein ligase ORTHRUS 2-like [Potentilla anserina]
MAHPIPLPLPCDADGVCMLCQTTPFDDDRLTCNTCVTPWHVSCLPSSPPESLAFTLHWDCPDCSSLAVDAPAVKSVVDGGLIAAIHAVEADATLTEQQKASKRQKLMSGKAALAEEDGGGGKGGNDSVLDGIFNCSFCMQLPERPVTTPCGHNFCLKCFQKWVGQGKRTCAKCRHAIPSKMASQPRINSSLVVAIRMAKLSKSHVTEWPSKVCHFVRNEDRPDKAFTTERAQNRGKSNAASGKIFVTIPADHFGPISAEYDPERNQGVLVGECWEDRLECRQWGAHFPHVAGIAGQANHGAQSVVLSGGYLDDEDHGEWFLYTGSGGRDLSGNKRTNKDQSFDQTFEKYNKALQVSCMKGYPVRVVRSHKEKRSSYAPEKGLRYDGVYRIEKCWTKVGIQGFKVCRYLFVRCDNEPAPWTSDEHGDRPRPLPIIPELKKATSTIERKSSPSWDLEEKYGCWKWKKSPPISKKSAWTLDPADGKRSRKGKRKAKDITVRERLLREFSCLICGEVMISPITTPCAHNFCKSCLEGAFTGKSLVRERNRGGRTLRTQKNIMSCPSCPTDISDFLQNPQVNRELMDAIESLKSQNEEEENGVSAEEMSDDVDNCDNEISTEMVEETGSKGYAEYSPTKCNHERTPKLQKVAAGLGSPRTGAEVEETSVTQTNGNGSLAPVANCCEQDAGESGVAANTRGRKNSQEVLGEDYGSPSSPLLVQSYFE